MTTPTSKVMDRYKSPLEAIKDDGLWPFIKDAVSGQTGQIVKVLLPDRKTDRAAGSASSLGLSVAKTGFYKVTVQSLLLQLTTCTIAQSAMSQRAHKFDDTHRQSINVTLAANHEESDFDPVSVTRWQRGVTQEASMAMLERFREDDDQISGLNHAELDGEDLTRCEETHESVMNYNDYVSQPHIQQFHADMDRNESAEDCRKGGEEENDEPQTVPRLVHSLTESPSSPPEYFELFKVLQTLSWIRWPVSPS
ncbi:hypothetical protein CGCSCA4_v004226 [Colletotrichum siamense]|uniref:Uncharacterized protein n=1 Tax=Colletotrichum siamense TaxID=690259 RepID=A0A9P5F0Y0_COLSI|nr:hypothetical protein CGCSCA4_v004226 [Colletotrichum siamense]KAF4863558.1 hypothetical protein CGCSCA2_v002918 [Colletotrichum siamense]